MSKKRWLPLGVAVLLCTNIFPVSATELTQELTDTNPLGATDVMATVEQGTGAVTYIISIPDKIDFGKLQKPTDNASSNIKSVNFTVTATKIDGLDTATSRVAVLLKDASSEEGFVIKGADQTNEGKILSYNVLNSTGINIATGTEYNNGYPLAAFSATGEEAPGTLQLDQNQLYMANLNEWAGNFSGQINFYSTVASIRDFN